MTGILLGYRYLGIRFVQVVPDQAIMFFDQCSNRNHSPRVFFGLELGGNTPLIELALFRNSHSPRICLLYLFL